MCRCQLKKNISLKLLLFFFFLPFFVVEVRDCEEKRAQRSCGSECAARRGQDRQPPGDVTDCGSEAGGGGGGHLLVCYGRFPSCQSV